MKKDRIIILVLLVLFISCGRDEGNLKIMDFTKSKTIVVKPYKNYPYAMMNVWVKGYANDTILIKLNSKENNPILKLSGKIDERWYTDYYGEGERMLIFDPFKANKGELEIKIEL